MYSAASSLLMSAASTLSRSLYKVKTFTCDDEELTDELAAFRYRIYIEELRKPLAYADHKRKRLHVPFDDSAFHLIAKSLSGSIVGCVRLHMLETTQMQYLEPLKIDGRLADYPLPFGYISKLMVERSMRGQGCAVALMEAMVTLGHTAPHLGEIGVFHCHPKLVPLYSRMGFRCFGTVFRDAEVGLQQPMIIIGGDVEHFNAVRSPMRSISKRFALHPARLDDLYTRFDLWPGSIAVPLHFGNVHVAAEK